MFLDTSGLSFAANKFMRTGRYCDAPYGHPDYRAYWKEIRNYSRNGYTHNGITITGHHFFFLNFHPMKVTKNPKPGVLQSDKIKGFPKFQDLQYEFFHHLDVAEKLGKHFCLLKPRGTGFSEIMSSIGTGIYTTVPDSKSFYFASHLDYLLDDGVVNKVHDNMNFLNTSTDRGFRHLRQKIDREKFKRASVIDSKGDEKPESFMSEIHARVIDNPRKVRGARTGTQGKVFFEEGGSFPGLEEAVTQTRPLVEQGGMTVGQIIVWGTGGEQGPGIAGLENVFYNPEAFNMYSFDNTWEEERLGSKSCWFFPVHHSMDAYYDKNGNMDRDAGYAHHKKERETLRKFSPTKEDRYTAEYPFTPSEALTRLVGNDFPIAEIKRQLAKIDTDPNIKSFIKHGHLLPPDDETGRVRFQIDDRVVPINSYPWPESSSNQGCVSILETPYRNKEGYTPRGMYQLVVDPYYKDESMDSSSLGAAYVYKGFNNLSETEDDIIVAEYVARPKTTEIFAKNVFLLAKYYNCTVQSEIMGGGKNLLSYARNEKLIHLCELQPDIIFSNQQGAGPKTKSYFMDMPTERKREGLQYLIDYANSMRSLSVPTDNGKEIQEVSQVSKIYFRGLLEEMLKYNDTGNFDRISALILLMFMRKDRNRVAIKQSSGPSFWDKPLFTSAPVYQEDNSQMNRDDLRMSDEV